RSSRETRYGTAPTAKGKWSKRRERTSSSPSRAAESTGSAPRTCPAADRPGGLPAARGNADLARRGGRNAKGAHDRGGGRGDGLARARVARGRERARRRRAALRRLGG